MRTETVTVLAAELEPTRRAFRANRPHRITTEPVDVFAAGRLTRGYLVTAEFRA